MGKWVLELRESKVITDSKMRSGKTTLLQTLVVVNACGNEIFYLSQEIFYFKFYS